MFCIESQHWRGDIILYVKKKNLEINFTSIEPYFWPVTNLSGQLLRNVFHGEMTISLLHL